MLKVHSVFSFVISDGFQVIPPLSPPVQMRTVPVVMSVVWTARNNVDRSRANNNAHAGNDHNRTGPTAGDRRHGWPFAGLLHGDKHAIADTSVTQLNQSIGAEIKPPSSGSDGVDDHIVAQTVLRHVDQIVVGQCRLGIFQCLSMGNGCVPLIL